MKWISLEMKNRCRCEEGALSDEATSSSLEIASGTPALAGGAREEQERPRNDIGNGEAHVSLNR